MILSSGLVTRFENYTGWPGAVGGSFEAQKVGWSRWHYYVSFCFVHRQQVTGGGGGQACLHRFPSPLMPVQMCTGKHHHRLCVRLSAQACPVIVWACTCLQRSTMFPPMHTPAGLFCDALSSLHINIYCCNYRQGVIMNFEGP